MSGTKLEATAQLLDVEPGLYAVEILSRDPAGSLHLMFPCARLDPITSERPGAGRAFVSALGPTPFFAPGAHPAYLRVEGGRATVLLTIYKPSGVETKPELRIRLIDHSPTGTVEPVGLSEQPLVSLPLTLLTHIERAGDVHTTGGQWAGQQTGTGTIEGFSMTPSGDLGPSDIEYQAVLGTDWTTPWLSGGEFCGSRGLSLPLLGARIRLRGEAAKSHRVSYWGSFMGAGEVGPIANGAVCSNGGAPMVALRVTIERQQTRQIATSVNQTSSAVVNVVKSKPRAPVHVATPLPPAKPQAKGPHGKKALALTSIRSKLGRK